MTAGYLEWLQDPSSRALRDAGPPAGQVFAGLVVAVAIAIILSSRENPIGPFWVVVEGAGALCTGIVAVADRDGWRIRKALAYIGLNQRSRWGRGSMPESPTEAAAWLEDAANADASALERASILIGIDRWAEARALLDECIPSTDHERAWLVRIRSMVDGARRD